MSETKKGIVTLVASSKGIKLEGEDNYYNPIGKCKEYVKTEMKGKEVELTLTDGDDHKFAFIKVIGGTSVPTEKPKAEGSGSGQTRSFALAYSKDLAVARIAKGESIATSEILLIAEKFDKYMRTGSQE